MAVSFGCAAEDVGFDQSITDAVLLALNEEDISRQLDRSPSIPGTDSNENGVRDDIDNLIDLLPDTEEQKAALRQASRAIRRAMMVDLEGATVETLESEGIYDALDNAVHCIWSNYDVEVAGEKAATVEKITVNTYERVVAYAQFNRMASGSVSQLPTGDTCATP